MEYSSVNKYKWITMELNSGTPSRLEGKLVSSKKRMVHYSSILRFAATNFGWAPDMSNLIARFFIGHEHEMHLEEDICEFTPLHSKTNSTSPLYPFGLWP